MAGRRKNHKSTTNKITIVIVKVKLHEANELNNNNHGTKKTVKRPDKFWLPWMIIIVLILLEMFGLRSFVFRNWNQIEPLSFTVELLFIVVLLWLKRVNKD